MRKIGDYIIRDITTGSVTERNNRSMLFAGMFSVGKKTLRHLDDMAMLYTKMLEMRNIHARYSEEWWRILHKQLAVMHAIETILMADSIASDNPEGFREWLRYIMEMNDEALLEWCNAAWKRHRPIVQDAFNMVTAWGGAW